MSKRFIDQWSSSGVGPKSKTSKERRVARGREVSSDCFWRGDWRTFQRGDSGVRGPVGSSNSTRFSSSLATFGTPGMATTLDEDVGHFLRAVVRGILGCGPS